MPQMDAEEFKFPDELGQDAAKNLADDIEVEIEDDTPEEDRGRTPMPKTLVEELDKDDLESYDEGVKQRLKQMRKVWHDERREKEAALREQQEALTFAQRLFEENKRIKTILTAGEKRYSETLQSAATMELEAAKKEYKDAFESGDSDRVLEAQQKLQAANLKVITAKNFKLPPLQTNPVNVQRQPEPAVTPKASAPDPKAQAWQERNAWFGQNKSMTAFALGVHEELKEEGVEIGSEEYYQAVDKTMRKRFPDAFDSEGQKSQQPRQKASTVVAPAVRSTASNKVRLRASQVQLAKKLGLTPEQYAKEALKLESRNG
jgi:hypothetical protein